MNKKLFAIVALLFSFALLFNACGDDDNEVKIDEEWVAYHNKQVDDVIDNPAFKERKSLSGNGSVYWRSIDFLAETPTTKSLAFTSKITESGTPYSTDSIAIRYEGRFYLKDGTPYIFDTTEGDQNGRVVRMRVNGFIDGFSTMLQYMKKGDEVEVCIPHKLGYGTAGKYNNTTGALVIPGYTTLWFKIRLIDIIPDNPGEFD